MDGDIEMSAMPGDGLQLEDVRDIFEQGAADLHTEQMLFMEGFTLHDAMSAFEIGEPRLDTGYVGENPPPAFNPLAPLLPEEVCWILDRSISYEMEWHTGNMLPHTIFTLQYVHCLLDIEPDAMTPSFLTRPDTKRPLELITVVLGSCVQGLLKSCDLTWREMHGNESMIHDTEDWQSDKCEISVLEAAPVNFILSRLDDAAIWVTNSSRVDESWKNPLKARILLRQTMLELFNTDPCRNHRVYQDLLNRTSECLQYLRSLPSIELAPESPAHLAFDPYISRCLNTSVPVRVIPISSGEHTWKALGDFLEGLQEARRLVVSYNLATWEVFGKLRTWLPGPPRPPYIRSLIQTSFYNGLFIIGHFTFAWALDRLFLETIGISWSAISTLVTESWSKSSPPPTNQFERQMYKLILYHIKANWLNPPRMRRQLMKSVVEWHVVYDLCVSIVEGLREEVKLQDHIISKLPEVILTFRLECIREIVFSGFQLELYAPEERPLAYWYAAKVIQEQLACFDKLLPRIPKDSPAHKEMVHRLHFSTALRSLSTGLFLATMTSMTFDWDRLRPNFYRRYKWAHRPDYEEIKSPPVAHPGIYEFMQVCMKIVQEEHISPREHVQQASVVLKEMVRSEDNGAWAGQWLNERKQFVRGLLDACERLSALPGSVEELEGFDHRLLQWDPALHPWFPSLKDPVSKAA